MVVDMASHDMEKDTSPGLKGKMGEKLQKHSHDADAAMRAFEGMDGQVIELTEEKSRALLKKIDRHLMPVRRLHLLYLPRRQADDRRDRSCALSTA